MSLFELVHSLIVSLLSQPYFTVPAVLVLLYLLFKRPKAFIILVFSAIALAAMVNIFSKLLALGLEHKPMPLLRSNVILESTAHTDSTCPDTIHDNC